METVIYEKEGEIAWIKLNRPEVLNAINYQMMRDFLVALEKTRWDAEVKIVIIKGEGRAFCSGADVKEASTPKSMEEKAQHRKDDQDIARLMRNLGKPIIAAIQGYAVGAGCEIAMACDIRIAAEGTQFGFPEANVGSLVTVGGLWTLTRLVGLGRAKELIFTSDRIDAKEAERIGLVNKVVPPGELDKTVTALAKKISKNFSESVRLMKFALDYGAESSLETILLLQSNMSEIIYLAGTSLKGFTAKKEELAKKG